MRKVQAVTGRARRNEAFATFTILTVVTGRARRNEAFATFTILTVITGLLHCVSVIPKMLFYIAYGQDLENGYNFLYYDNDNNFTFWIYFSKAMVFFNNSFNFYVYCLAGRDFRRDVRHVMTRCSTRNNASAQIVLR
jgi:hypothetical protein